MNIGAWRNKMIKEVQEGYRNKLKSKLFGLLCEFEKNGEWEAFLESIEIELAGIPENERTINYLTLCNKINALRYLKYEYFRKTILDCMIVLSKGDEDGIL